MESLLYACGVMGGMLLWRLYFSFIRCTGTFYVLVTRAVESTVWICIHFLRIRIQLLFSMQIRIQLLSQCGSGSSLKNSFKKELFEVEKGIKKKIAQK